MEKISKELTKISKSVSDLVEILSGVFITEVPSNELINTCPKCKSTKDMTLVSVDPYVLKCPTCGHTSPGREFQEGYEADTSEPKCPECGESEIVDSGNNIYRCQACNFENYKEKFYGKGMLL